MEEFRLEAALRLAEAVVFASPEPVSPRELRSLLPEGVELAEVMAALRGRYASRGVNLAEVGDGWRFQTAPDLAPALRKIVQSPRRLPRAAMEALAVIAYHQPVTRAEIEAIRGVALAASTMEILLEAGVIEAKGHKEAPGRPTLWGTGAGFLQKFGLNGLRDLPRREDLVVEDAPQAEAPVPEEKPS